MEMTSKRNPLAISRARHFAAACAIVAIFLSAFGCGGGGRSDNQEEVARESVQTGQIKPVHIKDPGVYDPANVELTRNVDQVNYINDMDSTWEVRFAGHSPFQSPIIVPANQSRLSGTSAHTDGAHAYAIPENPSRQDTVLPDSLTGPGVWVQ